MREGCRFSILVGRSYPSIEAVKLSQLHASHEVKTCGQWD